MKNVVRVGVLNNFNCTAKEFAQLDSFVEINPNKYFFINSNINTPKLEDVNNHPYKVVITLNPNITDWGSIGKLAKLNKDKVAFVRVKYVPGIPMIPAMIKFLTSCGFKVVITMQRFNGKSTVKDFGIKYYKFSYNRYRLIDTEKAKVLKLANPKKGIYICDEKGTGCSDCGLCSKLTLGEDLPIYSLNLSTSGLCPYSCIDCYAKTMQHFVIGCGYDPIKFDVIKKNSKQKGTTKHIKDLKTT